MFKIPPRSPNLNPIENYFYLLKKRLKQEAIEKQMEKESIKEFSKRVRSAMLGSSVEQINNIIDSMNKRVVDILKSGGYRTKY